MKSAGFYGSTNAVVHDNITAKVDLLRSLVARKGAKLMVVSDFDHTLTKFTSPQCHDIVGFNKEYSTDFVKEFKSIFYKPMASLSEWWRAAHDLLVTKSGLTKDMLQERLDERVVAVRDGLESFAVNLRLNHVPLVIVSAGIKDVISHTLQQHNLPVTGDELFHIDANFMEFHESGNLTNILPEDPVHSESKSLVNVRAAHMFEVIEQLDAKRSKGRSGHSEEPGLIVIEDETNGTCATSVATNGNLNEDGAHEEVVAIVLGDRPHDFHVLEAYPWVHTFRIGFARSEHSEDVADLMRQGACDAVLVGEEHSLEPVHKLMDELIRARDGQFSKVENVATGSSKQAVLSVTATAAATPLQYERRV